MGKILDFLFGKSPDIFDAKGEVQHNLPDDKWSMWNARYQQGEEFNWRNHAGARSSSPTNAKPTAAPDTSQPTKT